MGPAGGGVSNSGLVGWWKLDESSGSAADSSGNGYTLTTVAPVTWLPAGGKIAGAADLGSTTGTLVSTEPQAALDSINDTVTTAFWVKNNGTNTAWNASICKANAGNTLGWCVGWYNTGPDGLLTMRTSGGSNQASGVFPAIYDGKWHHVAFTANRGTTSLYVDGVLEPIQKEVESDESVVIRYVVLTIEKGTICGQQNIAGWRLVRGCATPAT
jgi:hypothetical protein